MLNLRTTLVAAAATASCLAWSNEAEAAALSRIAEEGITDSRVMSLIDHLTNRIGARLTGSPQLDEAELWAMDRLRDYGLSDVRREQWGEIPAGFYRGTMSAKIVSPTEREMEFSMPSWSPGTDGPVAGRVLRNPGSLAEVEALGDDLSGAWILMGDGATMRNLTRFQKSELDEAVDEWDIAGRIWGSRNEYVQTNGSLNVTRETFGWEPRVLLPDFEYEAVVELMDDAQTVEVEIHAEHIWTGGPAKTYNVLAEIPGTEKPDELVIICAHLDSWDGPGATGAADNALGVAVAMEAARLIMESGVMPKRTIQIALWSGEEQGLHGSRAYVLMHQDKLQNIQALINEDAGPNRHATVAATAEMADTLRWAIAPINDAFPDMPMEVRIIEEMRGGGGSDHAPFMWAGVPAMLRGKTGPHPYQRIWHTQYDSFGEIIPNFAVQMATGTAILAFNLANAEQMLPRIPVSRNDDGAGIPGFVLADN